jgi:hypothetical protein
MYVYTTMYMCTYKSAYVLQKFLMKFGNNYHYGKFSLRKKCKNQLLQWNTIEEKKFMLECLNETAYVCISMVKTCDQTEMHASTRCTSVPAMERPFPGVDVMIIIFGTLKIRRPVKSSTRIFVDLILVDLLYEANICQHKHSSTLRLCSSAG